MFTSISKEAREERIRLGITLMVLAAIAIWGWNYIRTSLADPPTTETAATAPQATTVRPPSQQLAAFTKIVSGYLGLWEQQTADGDPGELIKKRSEELRNTLTKSLGRLEFDAWVLQVDRITMDKFGEPLVVLTIPHLPTDAAPFFLLTHRISRDEPYRTFFKLANTVSAGDQVLVSGELMSSAGTAEPIAGNLSERDIFARPFFEVFVTSIKKI